MNTPPMLMGAALLFWGWQTGFPAFGIGMALVLEGSRLVPRRLDFGPTEFQRAWDLTSVLFVGAAIYAYSTDEVSGAVFAFLQWIPLVFFPFMVLQAYCAEPRMELETFFWLLRRKKRTGTPGLAVNVSFPYLALCLLSASANDVRDQRYYLGLCTLIGWALWATRPKRCPALIAMALFAGIGWTGYLAHSEYREWQLGLENRAAQRWLGWLRRTPADQDIYSYLGRPADPKQGRAIVLRIEPKGAAELPRRLRQATFNHFSVNSWHARRRTFAPVRTNRDGEWALLPGHLGSNVAFISAWLKAGRCLLALPLDTARITNLPVREMDANSLGVVSVANGPEAIRFEIQYGAGASIDGAPRAQDLQIPETDRAALVQLVEELGLNKQAAAKRLKTLQEFFEKRFRYTLQLVPSQIRANSAGTPVSKFLLRHRAGHCELFASATVLLLRQAGIPARYATGFVVDESSRRGNMYFVRERHRHAWALGFVDGEWREVDTTPASALTLVHGERSAWEPWQDWWSGLWFKFTLWRWQGGRGSWTRVLVWMLVPLVLVLAWRLLVRRKSGLIKRATPSSAAREIWPGLDSELFLIEARLAKLGLERPRGETSAHWLRRLAAARRLDGSDVRLQILLPLHYRYRFDPSGLSPHERSALAEQARLWLEEAARRGKSC